jgi:hypothetical protein
MQKQYNYMRISIELISTTDKWFRLKDGSVWSTGLLAPHRYYLVLEESPANWRDKMSEYKLERMFTSDHQSAIPDSHTLGLLDIALSQRKSVSAA